jgi:hypothetical protein
MSVCFRQGRVFNHGNNCIVASTVFGSWPWWQQPSMRITEWRNEEERGTLVCPLPTPSNPIPSRKLLVSDLLRGCNLHISGAKNACVGYSFNWTRWITLSNEYKHSLQKLGSMSYLHFYSNCVTSRAFLAVFSPFRLSAEAPVCADDSYQQTSSQSRSLRAMNICGVTFYIENYRLITRNNNDLIWGTTT